MRYKKTDLLCLFYSSVTLEVHGHVVLYPGRLAVSCLDTLFPLSLSFIFAVFFLISLALYHSRRLPWRGETCLYRAATLKWISWYIRSPFHFPGMWPGSYWWCGFRRQWTGPEVKLLLCYCTCLLSYWKSNSSAVACEPDLPSGFFSAQEEKRQRDETKSVCLCVFMHASMCMSFIFPTSTAI